MAKEVTGKSPKNKNAKSSAKTTKKVQIIAESKKKKPKLGTSSTVFAKRIKEALQAQDRWTAELNMTVIMAADALHVWSRAKDEIAKLDTTWTKEESKYGFKLVEHPALKTHREYMKEARYLLKALGLTIEDIVNKERDALTDFDNELED